MWAATGILGGSVAEGRGGEIWGGKLRSGFVSEAGWHAGVDKGLNKHLRQTYERESGWKYVERRIEFSRMTIRL